MDKPLITIVIPCFNAEKNINNTLLSLTNQTYPKELLQIIAVDDHSADKTRKILEDIAKLNANIEVVSCRTKGVSEARNTGIELAKGKYIAFIDSDDMVAPNHIENLYNIISDTNADLAVTSYRKVKHNAKYRNLKFSKNKKTNLEIFDKTETCKRLLCQKIEFCVWNKLYSTKILHDNNIEFNKDCRYNEDSYFNYIYIKCINKAVCSPQVTYFYVQSKNSLVRQKFKESRLDMYLSLNAIVNDAYQNYPEVKEYSHAVRALMASELVLWIYKSDYSNYLTLNKIIEYFILDCKHLKKCKYMQKYRRLLIPLIPKLCKILLRKRLKPKEPSPEYILPKVLN